MFIREFVRSDRVACLDVFQSNVPKFFVPEEQQGFASFLESLPGPYLVIANQSAQVIGCGGYVVNPETHTADLCWGMIRQDHHGQGFGKLLLAERLNRAKANPAVHSMRLDTSQHTTGFYERFGFTTIEIQHDGYGAGLHRCEMELIVGHAANP